MMKMNRSILYFCTIILAITACHKIPEETATSGRLTACVTESYLPLVKKHADEFTSIYTDAKVTLLGVSTREATVDFLNDSVKLVVIDRPFNQEEQTVAAQANLKYRTLKIAEDALAIIVNKSNKIDNISLNTLKDIVNKNIPRWDQLPDSKLTGSIEFVFTDKNSGAYELLKNNFLKLKEDIVPTATVKSQKNVFEYVAANPLAFGIISVACLKSVMSADTASGEIDSSGPVRALSIVSPDSTGQERVNRLNQANIYLGNYPLHYPVYVYFYETHAELAAGFCSYIASAPGQRIILKSGLVPATMPVRLVQLNEKREL
jgi:phosphate transport system substrate-binding protein